MASRQQSVADTLRIISCTQLQIQQLFQVEEHGFKILGSENLRERIHDNHVVPPIFFRSILSCTFIKWIGCDAT